MASAPPSARDLDTYRDRIDRFIAELDEEYYLHYAGHKDTLDLKPLYERYPELSELDQAQALGAAATDGDSGVKELWRFACENYLGELTREHSEKVAALEAELEAQVDGETVGYRMIRPTMANSEDRGRRQRFEEARNRLTEEHINPLLADGVATINAAVPRLGSDTYRALYERFGFRLEELADQCRAVLESTEKLYEETADRLFRARAGVGLSEAQRWDVTRVFRAPGWDEAFPAEKMLPALEVTLTDLGIDLRSQENVELDIEQRPKKSPRAFCAPIEVPGRVVLVIQPMGGADDWRALFHEAGHTEHYAHVSEDLPVEAKRLGDVSVTEAWATLMEHFLLEPGWLSRRLDFPKPEEFAAEAATGSLYLLRRYCGKLLYELEFHASPELDPKAMSSRYVELLGDALKIEPSPTDFLGDIDPSYYVTGYLRSWALQSQLREHFRERFGSAWFADRKAGGMLRELWAEGHRMNADELLAEVTGEQLEMEAFASSLREQLR
jgi:oligoendopeptidase F